MVYTLKEDGIMLISINNMNDLVTPTGVSISAGIFDPCEGCELKEWCDAGECAAHGFELDSNEPPRGTFEDWAAGWYD